MRTTSTKGVKKGLRRTVSRYNNVITLLDVAENYDNEKIVTLVFRVEELTEAEELAEDIAFVICSLWGMVPAYLQEQFKNRLTDEIVDVEIKEMFTDD